MPTPTILSTSQAVPVFETGLLVDAARSMSLQLFEQNSPYDGVNAVKISANVYNQAKVNGSSELFLGELRCVALACVSDASALQASSTELHGLEPAMQVNYDMVDRVENLYGQVEFQQSAAELLQDLPNLQRGLSGDLPLHELSTLVSQLQSKLLGINAFTQEHYGDLGPEVDAALQQIQSFSLEELLASVQVDAAVVAQPGFAGYTETAAAHTTLDGLFTSPEAFPLTLDFSSPDSVMEASELFASTTGSSSISSTASDPDSSSSFGGSGGHDLG